MSDENTQNGTSDNQTRADSPMPPGTSGASSGNVAATAPTESRPRKKKNKTQGPQGPQSRPGDAASTEPPETVPALDTRATPDTPATPEARSQAAASAASPVEVSASPVEVPAAGLRLRVKIWTDPASKKRYLIPTAFMRDFDAQGRPITDVMYAYVMSDDDTKLITLRASEWNALPFFYFQEDGPAPRASARAVDVIG